MKEPPRLIKPGESNLSSTHRDESIVSLGIVKVFEKGCFSFSSVVKDSRHF